MEGAWAASGPAAVRWSGVHRHLLCQRWIQTEDDSSRPFRPRIPDGTRRSLEAANSHPLCGHLAALAPWQQRDIAARRAVAILAEEAAVAASIFHAATAAVGSTLAVVGTSFSYPATEFETAEAASIATFCRGIRCRDGYRRGRDVAVVLTEAGESLRIFHRAASDDSRGGECQHPVKQKAFTRVGCSGGGLCSVMKVGHPQRRRVQWLRWIAVLCLERPVGVAVAIDA